MKIMRTVSGCVALALGLAVAGTASAQTNDKAVYFTFSQPVAVPQKTLPAGRYLFRLADTIVKNTVVQVYDADGSQLQAMFMTFPSERAAASEQPEIRFLETAANRAPAISSYWYPGERTGWEFVYPREQARQIAQASNTSVLTTARDVQAGDTNSTDFVRVSPTGEEMPATSAPAPAVAANTNTIRGERATNVPNLSPRTDGATGMSAQVNQNTQRTALPATATAMPAMTLAGVFAGIVFAVLRMRRTRS